MGQQKQRKYSPSPTRTHPSFFALNYADYDYLGSMFLLDRYNRQQTSVVSLLHGLHQVNTAFVASVPNSR